jgi:2-polyprenyl-6-methoxyphenol hydroxylase-like FAD-dependent oxidoreductase
VLCWRELKGIFVGWGHEAVGLPSEIGPGDPKATIEVATSDGRTETHNSEYVVGCDGGNSTVRRLVFGPSELPWVFLGRSLLLLFYSIFVTYLRVTS